jgi:hypothetical protein
MLDWHYTEEKPEELIKVQLFCLDSDNVFGRKEIFIVDWYENNWRIKNHNNGNYEKLNDRWIPLVWKYCESLDKYLLSEIISKKEN